MRRGFVLIELAIVITITAAMAGIAISLLLVLLRAEQIGRSHVARRAAIERLADRWRRDVSAAVGDVAVDRVEPRGCRLQLTGDCVVRYVIGASGVSREERIGSRTMRRESYSLPDDSTAAIEADEATSSPIVSLTILPRDATLRPGREIRIDAVQGRDFRFTDRRKEGER